MKNIRLNHQKIANLFFIFFVFIIIFYTFYKTNFFFSGPILTINSPLNWDKVESETFFVSGNVKNSSSLKINGKDILVNENGDFKEEIISKLPYNIIIISAEDRYKNISTKILKVVKI